MTRLETIRGALECALPQDSKRLYLSHPVTSGGRPMCENIEMAAKMAAEMRRYFSRPVVNPTGIGHIEGWDHGKWMELRLPFIRDRARSVIMAPDWKTSRGCSLERACALESGVHVVDYHELIRLVKELSDG